MEKIIPHQKAKNYQMPTRVIFGRGAFERIADFSELKTGNKILLVTGQHFKITKEFHLLKTVLGKSEREIFVYKGEISKSSFEIVNRLSEYCSKIKPEMIIAIGGGTILDTAKCAAILAKNGGKAGDYLKDKVRQLKDKGIPLVAVPTTAGTGSEVTPWAVIWDIINKKKYSLASPLMFPLLAVVDPSLTDNLPAKITAETGMDALTHAIEAYWSKFHNPISDRHALKAIKLIINNIDKAVNAPDKKTRDNMAKGSLSAGLAFSNTKTTICHSVSYPMTAYFGIAHGQAVVITLPSFIEYSLVAMEKTREKELLRVIGGKNRTAAAKKITVLIKKCSLATKLSQLGINRENFEIILKEGFDPERINNAPRIPTKKVLKAILEKIL